MGINNGHEKTSLIISILSAFIALCALALSVYMGWLQKINYEISVQPYITLIPTVDPKKKEYGFYIYNAGMGKRYIENVEFFINGRKVEGNNLDALKKLSITLVSMKIVLLMVIHGKAIRCHWKK